MSAIAAAGFQTWNLIPNKCSKLGKIAILSGVCYSDASSFYKYPPKLQKPRVLQGLVNVLLRDICFDTIVYTLTEILLSDLQQVKIIPVFNSVSFVFLVFQLPASVPLLRIRNSKLCSMFKSSFMLLRIPNNGGNKLFLMCKFISNKGSIAKYNQNQWT